MFKKVVVASVFFTLLQKGTAIAGVMPVDSVGLEMRNGKNYIVHKVVPKETLFALSRKYHVPVNLIVDANPNIQSGISVGQIVYVPGKTPVAAPVPTTPYSKASTSPSTPYTYVVDAKGNKIHQVVPKQTLYSIARMYNLSTEEIKKWNNLTSNNLEIGQDLIVGYSTKPTSNPQYVGEVDDTMEKNKPAVAKTPAPRPEEVPVVKTTETPRPAEPVNRETVGGADREESNTSPSESVSKITESGLAELIDSNGNNNKYLALHRSAPIGSILQVKNIMNNQSVYVRVIGTLPDTGNNDKVVVKISKRAFQRLASIDNRFRVEVSYMP